jgi:hypothetical protein
MKFKIFLNHIYKYKIQYIILFLFQQSLSYFLYLNIPFFLQIIFIIMYLYIVIKWPFNNVNKITNDNVIKIRNIEDINFNIYWVIITFMIVTILKIVIVDIFCWSWFCWGMVIIITIPVSFILMISYILSLKINYDNNKKSNWLEYILFWLFILILIAWIIISFL